ncbi:putative ferric-chelate reductase 1 [Liparis tanakae]|uniref:Putative ferric-chelate reductase 1 n=1 Tax=Liparis tanakae TaxID=230148 RepID=A0A4Z2GBU6_9TELE|nr:putative ferric-chelate reductase 1 [Liparis tanakae]
MERVVLLLLCVAPPGRGYSSGGVTESCEGMRPRHEGLSPQTDPPPYTRAWVEIRAPASTPFIGFLLQAREVGGGAPVGSFALVTEGAQLLACSQRPNFRTFWVDVTSPSMNSTHNYSGGSTPLPTPQTPTTYRPAPPVGSISGADCGVTKLCFSQPASCDPAAYSKCYFMSAVALSPTAAAVRFEMTGPSDGYVSFGFSDDQMMGSDDIYICGVGGDGAVRLQRSFSTGRTTPRAIPLGNVSDVRASVLDGVISCSFTSGNIISTQRTTGVNNTYYLLFAHGPNSNGQIQFHTGTFISSDKVDVFRPRIVSKAGWPHIIKAHGEIRSRAMSAEVLQNNRSQGALMLTAWMTLGSVGMMVARYLKRLTKSEKLCGKDVWFLVHVAVMSLAIAATAIAFILSFSYAKAWSGGAHPVLGCLVLILSFLQLLLAVLRCGPQHPRRFLFNWFHALNAVCIKVLAVAAIFTGLQLIDSSLDQWLVSVMGGLVGWEALGFVLLEVLLKWRLNSADVLGSKLTPVDVVLVVLFFLGNLTFLVTLLVGIGKA